VGSSIARRLDAVLAELNGPKRPERLVDLMRSATRCAVGECSSRRIERRCREDVAFRRDGGRPFATA